MKKKKIFNKLTTITYIIDSERKVKPFEYDKGPS